MDDKLAGLGIATSDGVNGVEQTRFDDPGFQTARTKYRNHDHDCVSEPNTVYA